MNELSERLAEQLGDNAVLIEGLRPLDVPLMLVPRDLFNEAARTMNYQEARLVAEWASDETGLGSGYGIYACYSKGTEFFWSNVLCLRTIRPFRPLPKNMLRPTGLNVRCIA